MEGTDSLAVLLQILVKLSGARERVGREERGQAVRLRAEHTNISGVLLHVLQLSCIADVHTS